MAGGTGVSFKDLRNGKWKLRWREKKPGGGYKTRSYTMVGSVIERDAMVVQIRAALAEAGTFHAERTEAEAQGPANLIDGMRAFIAAGVDEGRLKATTADRYTSYTLRIAEHLHQIYGIPEDEGPPVTLLTRESFNRIKHRDRVAQASDLMRYAPVRLLLEAWRWMADDPVTWPHVPTPPFSNRGYLPQTPKYKATIAPTLADVDACLRHLAPKTRVETRMFGVFVRYTGLRSGTVAALERDDIDLERRELYIREDIDKNRYARTVPLSRSLLHEIGDWVATIPSGQPLFRKRRHSRKRAGRQKKAPTQAYKNAWLAATDAEQVQLRVWAPPNRKSSRPLHALRAAFDAHLMSEKVSEQVVDYLVGRGGNDVRSVHYGRDLLQDAREAVELIPPIDWEGPRDEADNVVRLEARQETG